MVFKFQVGDRVDYNDNVGIIQDTAVDKNAEPIYLVAFRTLPCYDFEYKYVSEKDLKEI